MSKPIDPQVMEEYKKIIDNLSTNDWSIRLKNIDVLIEFVKSHQV